VKLEEEVIQLSWEKIEIFNELTSRKEELLWAEKDGRRGVVKEKSESESDGDLKKMEI
jgi:hypothetical protein